MREAMYYEKRENGDVKCLLCPHGCLIREGQKGLCRVRANENGVLAAENYGKVTSISLDPIEKKPLRRFFPGSMILSVGSYGCNFHCPFCQNHSISMGEPKYEEIFPEILIEKASDLRAEGNIGIAYTYNEPLIGYEFVYNCASLAKSCDLKNVLVTNGFINEEPLLKLLPFIDAVNIDLKSFSDRSYLEFGGKLDEVKKTISLACRYCHVEITTLIVPDVNDSEEEIRAIAAFLANIDPSVPLHITRFFPRFQMIDKEPTPLETMYKLANTANKYLRCVYLGNI